MNIRSGFRGRRDLIFCSYTNKLILKTDCDPKNEMKCPDNSDNFSNIDNYILKLFFFRSYSAYYFCIPEIAFVGARRRCFDQISTDLFRASR